MKALKIQKINDKLYFVEPITIILKILFYIYNKI